MNNLKLTASEIRELDAITADKTANKNTLKVALNFHANMASELASKEREWWDAAASARGLDMGKGCYKVSRVEGSMSIVEAKPKDDEP